jgi:hypothetical protein
VAAALSVLAQVYGFAKQSGGMVRLRREINPGTTVEIFMRAAGADE